MSTIPSPLRKERTLNVTAETLFETWTTSKGIATFFAPFSNITLEIGGPYEILFSMAEPEGQRGAEGCHVLSFLPNKMLSFTWNAPPQWPSIRLERTWVVLLFNEFGDGRTTLELHHLGWRAGKEWEEVHAYFDKAWDFALNNLEKSLTEGPREWEPERFA